MAGQRSKAPGSAQLHCAPWLGKNRSSTEAESLFREANNWQPAHFMEQVWFYFWCLVGCLCTGRGSSIGWFPIYSDRCYFLLLVYSWCVFRKVAFDWFWNKRGGVETTFQYFQSYLKFFLLVHQLDIAIVMKCCRTHHVKICYVWFCWFISWIPNWCKALSQLPCQHYFVFCFNDWKGVCHYAWHAYEHIESNVFGGAGVAGAKHQVESNQVTQQDI